VRRTLFTFMTTFLVPLVSVLGQDTILEPGQIIRVTASQYDLRRTRVRLVGFRSESLQVQYVRKRLDHARVRTDSLQLAVPLSAVSKLETPAGRRSNWDKGAKTGAILGGVAGLALGVAFASCDDDWLCPTGFGQKAGTVASSTAIGGLAGGIVGAVIGAMSSREAWQEVPVGPARIGILPQASGFVVTASMRF